MSLVTEGVPCHARDCDSLATATCERCGHPCCTQHMCHISIKRRDDPDDLRKSHHALARLPTHVETYTLCLRCSKKPFAGNPSAPEP